MLDNGNFFEPLEKSCFKIDYFPFLTSWINMLIYWFTGHLRGWQSMIIRNLICRFSIRPAFYLKALKEWEGTFSRKSLHSPTHPQAVVAEIDSLSLTLFAGCFLNYCKTIVEKHGVTVLLYLSSQIMLRSWKWSRLLAGFLVQGKVEKGNIRRYMMISCLSCLLLFCFVYHCSRRIHCWIDLSFFCHSSLHSCLLSLGQHASNRCHIY